VKKLSNVSKWLRGLRRTKLIGVTVFMLAFAGIGTLLLIRSFAAGEKLYLTPTTGSVQVGSDYTVTVRVVPGGPSNAVDARISYDQTKLQFKSINTTTSAYTSNFIATGGNGSVNIVSGIIGSTVSTDSEVAKVTFTAIGNTAGAVTLGITGELANSGTPITLTFENATVNVTVPSAPSRSASYTIESTNASPLVGGQFGLRVYVTSDAIFQGGEVDVNLPTGLSYSGTLDTAGTAFNPTTTVSGTTAQLVKLVFVTQSTTLTGKQLVATIPVTGSTTGAKSITFSNARLVDLNSTDITPMTASPFSITINAASLPAPTVTIPGKTVIAATENITNLKQPFTITNFDSAATYTVTLGGQALTLTSNGFSIPASIKNGDLTLQVSATKSGASGSASFTIRLRSPNVNRVACVELLDLLVVNKAYGAASTESDLNFDGSVSLIDLLTVTGSWGGACI
jgi:hypothetical protein